MIYIAQKYTGTDQEMEDSYQIALKASQAFLQDNIPVISPIILTHEVSKRMEPKDHGWWIDYCEKLIDCCSALLVIETPDWHKSRGVAEEIGYAKASKIPVYYMTPENLKRYLEDGSSGPGHKMSEHFSFINDQRWELQ